MIVVLSGLFFKLITRKRALSGLLFVVMFLLCNTNIKATEFHPVRSTRLANDLTTDNNPVESDQLLSVTRPTLSKSFVIKNATRKLKDNHLIIQPLAGTTSETGGKTTFTIRLEMAITYNLALSVNLSNPGEGNAYPRQILFTPQNWFQEKIIVVTGKDDSVADGDQEYELLMKAESSQNQHFDEIVIPKVIITNQDDDIPQYIIGNYSRFTTEDGGKTSIPVKLGSQPLAPLELTLISSSPAEGAVESEVLRFTPQNWDKQQNIIVSGKNDFISDEDKAYQILVSNIETDDPIYQFLSFPRIDLVNKQSEAENSHILPNLFPDAYKSLNTISACNIELPDGISASAIAVKELPSSFIEPGVLVDQPKNYTDESGKPVDFFIQLNAKPTVDVVVSLKSSNSTEGTVSPSQLIFTALNWDKKQRATVKGEDDQVTDGDISFDIILRVSSDGDFRFSKLPDENLKFVNRDNDSAAIIMHQLQETTSENKTTAGFMVELSSRPSARVEIPIFSSNVGEGVPGVEKLLFLPEEWNTPKQVLVIGQDDNVADNNRTYQITAGPAISEDKRYSGIKSLLQFTNIDNDTPGLITSKISEATAENGRSISLPIRLKSEPVQDVFVNISSSAPTEGIPVPTRIRFNSKNWRESQVIKIVGQNDEINDGDITYYIHVGTTNSRDQKYQSLPDIKLTVENEDDDVAGIKIGKHENTTSESGGTISLPVCLSSEPLDEVILRVKSSNLKEGIVQPDSIIFTPQNWKTEQKIDVTGIDDDEADGDKNFFVEFGVSNSKDPRYQLLDPVLVNMNNHDNDTAGFNIKKPKGKTSENGDQISFSISLKSKPLHHVSIKLYSSDTSEGVVTPPELVFTPNDWSQEQYIQIKGINDKLVDGEQNYTIVTMPAVSDDPVYDGLNPEDVLTANLDNNLTTFFVSQIRGNTSENGQSIGFFIRLNSSPRGTIKIDLVSSNPDEAIAQPDSISFDPSNWDQNKKITITGLNDDFQDGDQPYKITITSRSQSDPAYNDIPPVEVDLINKDDDTAGIITRVLNKMSAESGQTAEFSIRLSSRPTSSVVLLFNSTNSSEGELITEHAAFHDSNWNREQIIRVRGINDNKVDGNQDYAIISSGAVSSDLNYNKIPFDDVKLVNKDIDEANFVISESSGATTEMGGTAQFTVRLNSIPQNDVTISISSDNPSEGEVDKGYLKFTPDNWNTDQIITVTGVDDFIKDEDKTYHVVFSSSISSDGNYHGLSPGWVTLKNLDNKRLIIGILVSGVYPLDNFGQDFKPSYELCVNGSYVFTKKITLKISYSTTTLTGTPEKELYGDMHKVDQSLELNTLMSSVKYFLIKNPIILSLQIGAGLTNWSYASTTLTDGTRKKDEGSDLTLSLGIGIDYAVYENLFFESLLGLQQLTGGLGDRRMLTFGLGLTYPF